MWNFVVRVGMLLSTVLLAKQVADRFWPSEIYPTRVYRAHEVARHLRVTVVQILVLVEAGDLEAKWVDGQPVFLGASILRFLARPT